MAEPDSITQQFEREDRAIKAARELVTMRDAYLKYLDKVREVKSLFREAGMNPLPSISGFLNEGQNGVANDTGKPKVIVTPPQEPDRPPEAERNWIWVKLSDLTTQTLVLAILRTKEAPMTASAIFQIVQQVDPAANLGSVQNIGTRLDGSLITRTEEGWQLIDKDKAPVGNKAHAWGPVSVFQPPEIATYRRSLIRHILSAAERGLQLIDIHRHLKNSGFLPGVLKDNVKGDLEVMSAKDEVVGFGRPTKWRLTKHGERVD